MSYKDYEDYLDIICYFKPIEEMNVMCIKHSMNYDTMLALSLDMLAFSILEDKLYKKPENLFVEAYMMYGDNLMYSTEHLKVHDPNTEKYRVGAYRNSRESNPERFNTFTWEDFYAWCDRKYSMSHIKVEIVIAKDELETRFESIL